jgi:hypothetical protein
MLLPNVLVLFCTKKQNGLEKVIAYGSRGLHQSEKFYPAHKHEFYV